MRQVPRSTAGKKRLTNATPNNHSDTDGEHHNTVKLWWLRLAGIVEHNLRLLPLLHESVNYQDVHSILTITEPILGSIISSWAFVSLPWWARPRKCLRSIVLLACRRQRTDDSNRSRKTKPFAMPRQIVCLSLVLMVDDPNSLFRIPFFHHYYKIYDLNQVLRKCQAKAKDVETGYSVELFWPDNKVVRPNYFAVLQSRTLMQPSAYTIVRAFSYLRDIISDNRQPQTRRLDSGDRTELLFLLMYNRNIHLDSGKSYLKM